MNRLWLGGAAVAALALPAHVPAATTTCEVCGSSQRSVVHDIVVVNGRVMDPASGLDAVRSIGISRGKIREISAHSLRGRDTIDARGMVVAPGFIDLHQHAQDDAGYRVEVLDGTTTALELEGGTADVAAWYRERAGRSLINYGVSVGHESIRMRVMGDTGHGAPVGPAKSRAATDEELAAILRQMFARLEWASTGERLTRDSFGRFRQLGGYVVDYNNTEAVVAAAVADSLTMIASDGILHDGVGHPRVAGTFARKAPPKGSLLRRIS